MSVQKLTNGFLKSIFSETRTVAFKLNELIDTVEAYGMSDIPAIWGSIGAGTGVGSQTDLVTYLNTNYVPKVNGTSQIDVTATYIGMTSDNGGYLQSSIYLATNEINVGFNQRFLDIDATSAYMRMDAYSLQFPEGVSGTLALTSQLADYLPLSGGTMTGSIDLGANNIDNWQRLRDGSLNRVMTSSRELFNSSSNVVAEFGTNFSVKSGATFYATLSTTNLTATRAFEFPNVAGSLLAASAVTSETVTADTTLTVEYNGTTYKLVALAV